MAVSRGQVQSGKEESWEVFCLPEIALRSLSSEHWVVSIEVSEDESVRGVRKDVRIEGPGARIRRTVSDGRGVEVKKLKRRVVGEKDFNTGVV